MTPTPNDHAARVTQFRPATRASAWLEFDELDDDLADEQALVRLIETQGRLAAEAWAFDAD
jgi:hypothetical protein